ncbi:ribosomal-protein-alanine acetyltransferase [Neokomagataea tanensis NBRC 106556]|uniref:Ribosomal-protein-alanine acetyltransferase n=1 Tax=Neokomagataea tanensis NBRC 106556 TaxID=1223519 RepID=A0ABQ0QGV4_9PROT|nr:ribosomal-protein-alanine acetyltransferase [Neokomagataea tanensis NBRC 106556]
MEAASVLAAMHAEVFAGGEIWSRESFHEIFTIPGTRAYCAHHGDLGLGLIVYRVIAGEVEILTLGTLSHARRRGVARRLVQEVLQYGTVFLEVSVQNTGAQALYHSLGFEVVGRRKRYYQDGSDATVLRRDADDGTHIVVK